MSLLDSEKVTCKFIDKTTVPDGYGGYTTEYSEGTEFPCNIILDQSMQSRIAEKQGVTALYTILTDKSIMLEFHQIIKRVADGQLFRITSKDSATPKTATLNIRKVNAEEYEIE